MRKATLTILLVAGLGALGVLALYVLETFREKGGQISLKPREKAGLRSKTMDTLVHGSGDAALRWSSDYADEILEVDAGRATKVKRTWVSFEEGAKGPPKPMPLQDVTDIDASGAKDGQGLAWKKVAVTWPDPFPALLPAQPVYHSGGWTSPATAAAAVASFLAREPAGAATAESKLEPEMSRDGIRCHRIRVALKATFEGGRKLEAWGDLYFDRQARLLIDMDWMGTIGSEESGERRIVFTRVRQYTKP